MRWKFMQAIGWQGKEGDMSYSLSNLIVGDVNNKIETVTTENDKGNGLRKDRSNNNNMDNLEKGLTSDKDTVVKEEQEPHCVFSKSKKMKICIIVSYVALISPLSGAIYYPALTQISQAVTPSFWGPISDRVDRRSIYIATITMFLAICVGLALAPSYPSLLVLRMFQAFGGSSAIALGGGVNTDFSTPADILVSCQTVSMTTGSMLGGIITNKLSWRWIFWILLMVGAVGLILVFFFVHETLRSLVGNGSGYANPTPSQWIKQRRMIPNFLEPFLILRYPDVFFAMLINGCFTYFIYCLMITTPPYFSSIYGLNELQVGCCYISLGAGIIFGSFLSGRLLNRDFRVIAMKQGIAPDEIENSGKLALDFPIYKARLRSCWVAMIIEVFVTLAYGWTLYKKTHLAIPIMLQFLGGLSSVPIFNSVQTLLTDLFASRGATVMASSNIVRCIFGAIAGATIQLGIDSVGLGWMFTIIGLISTITTCFVPILIKYGPVWRIKRSEEQSCQTQDPKIDFEAK
ncbi:major facilitator superfamily domain-containing protein [Phascolomyces articulosus]|uniref:Major facilitator superfamily domain-containing protein n=1 Tax=Phascolomyces articulosus TaxID=60185 RepID=A0AAD5P7R2_9FUNG|nr:major facilitator superfamily domain-containing protein [Phascolomyces articulosus]